MTRFQRLAAATVAAAFLLVVLGVVVRATDSGLACPHWPGCFPGQFLPGLDSDVHIWIEWAHRTVAAVIGLLIVGLAAFAVVDHRDRRSIVLPSLVAVLLVGFQAYLGARTVELGNTGESVTAHLAAAMALVGLLVYLLVRSAYPARLGSGGSQRFTLLAAFAAAAVFGVLLFGANVTARDAGLVFPDWPLMNGSLVPIAPEGRADLADLYGAHALHRYAAAVVLAILAAVAWVAWRRRSEQPRPARLAVAILAVYLVQVVVGALQVATLLAPWTQTLHVALGALVWGGSVALAVASYYEARIAAPLAGASEDAAEVAADRARQTVGEQIRAYVALTKPRIIELLLVTTVPAMVLATREVPGLPMVDWVRLTFWTLVCGTLAAGSANAINQYLERDIDHLMARTRRRPLPAEQVTPERAVVFGVVLGAVAVALMAWTVNVLAAFLTLLAIGFYVVVYTLLLKRNTPQNIVIGGAAGALPPVIGWAAVTGNVGLPALLLFLVVFYWTPPHFWALALRIRGDYAAAGVPMLPVVRGIAETSRQIGLYTILLVALTAIFAVVAGMGPIYAIAAAVLGALFLWRAYVLWRQGTSPEASTAQAIRLYRYSITYLTLLFAAVALDTVVRLPGLTDDVHLTFLGAASTVTGSRFLLTTARASLLIDCGMFQGSPNETVRNRVPMAMDPTKIDAIVITHAHLDHCGYLPAVVKAGFAGPIYLTSASAELVELVLLDSGRLQEEFADRHARWVRRHPVEAIAEDKGSADELRAAVEEAHRAEEEGHVPTSIVPEPPPAVFDPEVELRQQPPEVEADLDKPLYTEADAQQVMPLFNLVRYGKPIEVAAGITATFLDAGHILGSAIIRLEIREAAGDPATTIVFSGDLGRPGTPILRDATVVNDADYVVMESTYGGREHEPEGEAVRMLAEAVRVVEKAGGVLLIPSFAIGRTQEIVWELDRLIDRGEIPLLPLYLDSPMASHASDIYRRHPEFYDSETADLLKAGGTPLDYPKQTITRAAEASKAIATAPRPYMIVASNGMLTGGRVVAHLRNLIGDPDATILFVGYQGEGTLGAHLQAGARTVRLDGQVREVKCRIRSISGFSAHADESELLDWLRHFGAGRKPGEPGYPRTVFLVHGDPEAQLAIAPKVEAAGYRVHIPRWREQVELGVRDGP